MFRLFIWLMRSLFILLCAGCFITGVAILSYMCLPITVVTLMQFIWGVIFLITGVVMIYFIIDSWKE